MSEDERLRLIGRVMQTALQETETWEDENGLGVFLAYLAHAIANETGVDLWEDGANDRANLRLFRKLFPDGDTVWQFINVRALGGSSLN